MGCRLFSRGSAVRMMSSGKRDFWSDRVSPFCQTDFRRAGSAVVPTRPPVALDLRPFGLNPHSSEFSSSLSSRLTDWVLSTPNSETLDYVVTLGTF